jgi:hypothetical protein
MSQSMWTFSASAIALMIVDSGLSRCAERRLT